MANNKALFRTRKLEVDTPTGEILSDTVTTVYRNKSIEQFSYYTTTDGLEWAKPFKSHLLLLMVLNQYSDKDGIVSLSPHKRKQICKFFGWYNSNSLTNALSALVKLDGIRRINQDDLMINPETVFRGGTAGKANKQNKYNEL